MREFLRRVFVLNDYRERSWHVARLQYARWHTCLNCAQVRLEDVVWLWEEAGELVAIAMPDGGPGFCDPRTPARKSLPSRDPVASETMRPGRSR